MSLAGTATGFGTMGTVMLSQGTVIDISNGLFDPSAAVGSVVIRGGEVVLNTATIRSGNAQAVTEPLPSPSRAAAASTCATAAWQMSTEGAISARWS